MSLEIVPGVVWASGIHDTVSAVNDKVAQEKEALTLADIQAKLKWQVDHTKTLDPMHFAGNKAPLSPYFAVNGAASILDETGRLREPISSALVSSWKSELITLEAAHIVKNPARAAQLHIFLGEYALAANEAPEPAMSEFRTAKLLVSDTSSIYSRAEMDDAIALYAEGAYEESQDAFNHALNSKVGPFGFDPKCGAALLKHVSACVGYHLQHARIGIPEPLQLDKYCVAASLANSLKALDMASDKVTVLKSIKVTGEGSTFQDLVDACGKLNVDVHIVRVDDQGLRMLPKPLVSYVENDHFVSVTKADNSGVTYLCSDCGVWPGGEVHLTWKQWDTLNGSLMGVVTKKGSTWDLQLSALPDANHQVAPSQVPNPATLAYLGTKVASANLGNLGLFNQIGELELIKHVAIAAPCYSTWGCGNYRQALACLCQSFAWWFCPTDGGGPLGGGDPGCGGAGGAPNVYSPESAGPSANDPNDQGSGQEEYTSSAPPPVSKPAHLSGTGGTTQASDLNVYNPTGPRVIWGRAYSSLRGVAATWYEPYDFGDGWTTTYNVGVQDASSGGAGIKYLYFYNGMRVQLTAASVPSATNPDVSCTVAPGYTILADWVYNPTSQTTYFVITFSDRTKWVTTSLNTGTNCYLLYQVRDANYTSANPTLNVVTLNYAPDTNTVGDAIIGSVPGQSPPFPLLANICDGAGNPLLVINRATDGSGGIANVEDRYGRFVFYHEGLYINQGNPPPDSLKLDYVSQVVQGVPVTTPPMRYSYGYSEITSPISDGGSSAWATLTSITVPSPTGTGLATAQLNYTGQGYLSSLVDANGNTRAYTYGAGNTATTTVTGPGSVVPYTYTVTYDSNMDTLTRTDGGNSIVTETLVYGDSLNPFYPTQITDGNGKVSKYIYDSHGIGNCIETDSRFIGTPGSSGTTYLATLSPYSYTNFALGEVTQTQDEAMLTGTPNTVIQAKTPTSYTYYEPSGNIQTITAPAPGTVGSTSTVNFSYNYNVLGDLTTETTPGNNAATTITTTYGYASTPQQSEPISLTDALNHTTTYSYDSQSNVSAVIDALGNETDYSYVDPNSANGVVNVGELNKITYPPTTSNTSQRASTVINYEYPGGPVAKATAYTEAGASYREVDGTYGNEGEPLSVSGSVPSQSVTYDDLYRAVSLTDGNGHTTHEYYAARGYVAGRTFPGFVGSPTYNSNTGTWSGISGADSSFVGSYDNDGNTTSVTDGRGVTTSYILNDPDNQLTNVHYSLPASPPTGLVSTPDINVTYDYFGRASTVDNSVTRVTYGPTGTNGYDDQDELLNYQTGFYNSSGTSILFNKLITYAYYPDGSMQSESVPSGMFTASYDAAERSVSLTDPFSETTSFGYYNNDWPSNQTLANGATTAFSYNGRGQLTELKNSNSAGTTLSDFSSLSYDAVNNLLSVTASIPSATNLSGTTTYGYDNKDELTSEVSNRNGGYSNSFTYDGAQNPTTFRGSTVAAANADNQIPATGYSYDGDGNPTTYKGNSLTFDPEDRMVSYGSAITNAFTPDGLRVSKTTSSTTTFYLYDADDSLVCELNASGNITATNSEFSRASGGSSTFYAFDPQGSPAQVLDSSGNILSTSISDAYGTTSGSSSTDPYSGYNGGNGYANDPETGLQLLGHRFYDQSSGRFINRDPIGYDGGPNVYAYCQNSPVGWSDDDGFFRSDPVKPPEVKPPSAPTNPAPPKPGPPPPSVDPIPVIPPWVKWGGEIGIGTIILLTPTPLGNDTLPDPRTRPGWGLPGGPGYRGADGPGAEHKKNARPSTADRHGKGQARKKRDAKGGGIGRRAQPCKKFGGKGERDRGR